MVNGATARLPAPTPKLLPKKVEAGMVEKANLKILNFAQRDQLRGSLLRERID